MDGVHRSAEEDEKDQSSDQDAWESQTGADLCHMHPFFTADKISDNAYYIDGRAETAKKKVNSMIPVPFMLCFHLHHLGGR